jgi:hypothetical protein
MHTCNIDNSRPTSTFDTCESESIARGRKKEETCHGERIVCSTFKYSVYEPINVLVFKCMYNFIIPHYQIIVSLFSFPLHAWWWWTARKETI